MNRPARVATALVGGSRRRGGADRAVHEPPLQDRVSNPQIIPPPLRDDLEALQTDMKGLAGGVGDAAQARLNEMLRNTEDMADQITAQVEDWTNDNAESLREQVREQPLFACAVAMGIGALLGAILLRR